MFSDVIKWDFLGALTLVFGRRIFNGGAFLAVLFAFLVFLATFCVFYWRAFLCVFLRLLLMFCNWHLLAVLLVGVLASFIGGL